MAIESPHMNIFSPQLLSSRDCVKFKQDMNHGDFHVPFITGESLNRSESGFTNNFSLKRPRESQHLDADANFASAVKRRSNAFGSSFINAELLSQIQNQQEAEITHFVAQQTEKLRIEVYTRHQTQTRMLASAVQNATAKKLKEKDEEIARMRNVNYVLQERVKSLYVENQIWRDMAQTNEAHANNLRTNLDHVLSQVQTLPANVVEDDAESSCGSCVEGVIGGGCKRCGEREASVLVLPCRHLCLCSVCGSALVQTCPVCNSVMNASVHVNMSS